ncbi:hypothetical protein ACFLZV_04960 [Candidatus Margulisiibacteriota bacterium]
MNGKIEIASLKTDLPYPIMINKNYKLEKKSGDNYFLFFEAKNEEEVVEKAHWFLTALRIAHFNRAWIRMHFFNDKQINTLPITTFFYKLDDIESLSTNHIKKIKTILPKILKLITQHNEQKFNRIANSLGLFAYALYQKSENLKFVNLVIALEALYNVNPQELTFRLSIYISSFLGKTRSSKREYYNKLKNIFKIRGKIVHGQEIKKKNTSKLSKKIEVDFKSVLYDTEKILRESYLRILTTRNIDLFLSDKLEDHFVSLIF